ncbi:magnesium transporter CorA family protein [Anaerosacchariphilus polymeriproducens]|nr:CorA family divalent cation transporter [Anaerosacchariphilus polymeriproducens]
MYFIIQDGMIEEVEESEWKKSEDAIGIFTVEEWKKQLELNNNHYFNQQHDSVHFCKLECHAEYLYGTLCILDKVNLKKSTGFAFYIQEGRIIFIDDTGFVSASVENIAKIRKRREYSMERFLYDFLLLLIENDLQHLITLEREISKIEEEVLIRKSENFNGRMSIIKKEIARLYRYYSQLSDVGEGLTENENDYFAKNDITTFKVFTDRVTRLRSEALVLREYAMQVQDVYQSEISIRQNDVMKVLTIVTTIFLPLTLIVGWYGMNFKYMPELKWEYGYPVVILLCITVVMIGIWIFKNKKFW